MGLIKEILKITEKDSIKVDKDKEGKSYTNESIFEFLVNRKAGKVPEGIETTATFSGYIGSDGSRYSIGSGTRAAVAAALGFSENPTKAECDAKMATVTLGGYPDKKVTIHKDLVNEVQGIFMGLKRLGVKLTSVESYCFRPINNPTKPGSKTLSMHSFGCAIDINPGINGFVGNGKPWQSGDDTPNGKVRTINSPIVKVFESYGWGWGGHYGDYMHFSKANGG